LLVVIILIAVIRRRLGNGGRPWALRAGNKRQEDMAPFDDSVVQGIQLASGKTGWRDMQEENQRGRRDIGDIDGFEEAGYIDTRQ